VNAITVPRAFDEDWDFEAGIAEQCDAVGNESAWDAPWEEDPGSPSVAASPLTSLRLPCTDTQVVDTPSPQVARRELSLSPTPKVRKVITVKRPPTQLDEAQAFLTKSPRRSLTSLRCFAGCGLVAEPSSLLNLKVGNCGSDSGGEIDGLRVLKVGVKIKNLWHGSGARCMVAEPGAS
jgi:hypothetical protein